jgi:hypothetical protein
MKRSIFNTIAMLSLSAVLGSVHLNAQGPINVTVPFDFNVGAKSFHAGEYTVQEITTWVLAIRSADDRSSMLTSTTPGEPGATPGTAKLTFNRYGDRYFLSNVSGGGRGWALSKSAPEKELIAKRTSPKFVEVASSIK